MEQADALVGTGLLDAGSTTIHVDGRHPTIAEAETRKRISFGPPDPLPVWLPSAR
jgi:hypothetical protein